MKTSTPSWRAQRSDLFRQRPLQLLKVSLLPESEMGRLLDFWQTDRAWNAHGTLTVTGIVAIVVVAGPCLILGMALGLER